MNSGREANWLTWRRRKSILGVLLLVIVGYFLQSTLRHLGEPRERAPWPVNMYTYNFTPYGIEFQLGEHSGGIEQANVANGGSVVIMGYAPTFPDEPMRISWRYVTGKYRNTPADAYPFIVTLPQHVRPPGENVALTIRFYPEGKVAARYTAHPESADYGNTRYGHTFLNGPPRRT